MNKVANKHIKDILLKSNKYRSIDLYIYLSDLAQQIKVGKGKTEYKFIVMSNNSAYSIYEEINFKYPNIINSTTCRECLNELKKIGIVEYNNEYNGFELIDAAEMFNKKSEGYMNLREYFFSQNFVSMNFSEKKVLLFLLANQDKKRVSKAFKNTYEVDVMLNLNNYKKSYKKDKLNIMNVLKTNNVYYAKEVVDNLLMNYPDLFNNKSNEYRTTNFCKSKGKSGNISIDMIYYFDINDEIKSQQYSIEKQEKVLSEKYVYLNSMIDKFKEMLKVELSAEIKVFLMRKLYRYIPMIQKQVVLTYLNRVKEQLNINSTYPKIKNAKAFIQHLINSKPSYKNGVNNNNKYELEINDVVIEHSSFISDMEKVILPF